MPRDPMDKVSDYKSGDSKFESLRGQFGFSISQKGIRNLYICFNNCDAVMLCKRPRGPMDKASDYESGDSKFESLRGRLFL